MGKTFKELIGGDKVYVVNEGTGVGYIRIEEYMLEEPLHEDEKVKGCYHARQKDCSYDLIIHESLLNSNNAGFIFIELEDAYNYYTKKANDILTKMIKKLNELGNEYKKLYNDSKVIYDNLKELNINNLNIVKCYEDN